jgi:hypothetical protein
MAGGPRGTAAQNREESKMYEIIGYKTAGASGPDKLDVEVNRLIESGYQPFGSPYMSDQPVEGRVDAFAMWQAMVKYRQANSN